MVAFENALLRDTLATMERRKVRSKNVFADACFGSVRSIANSTAALDTAVKDLATQVADDWLLQLQSVDVTLVQLARWLEKEYGKPWRHRASDPRAFTVASPLSTPLECAFRISARPHARLVEYIVRAVNRAVNKSVRDALELVVQEADVLEAIPSGGRDSAPVIPSIREDFVHVSNRKTWALATTAAALHLLDQLRAQLSVFLYDRVESLSPAGAGAGATQRARFAVGNYFSLTTSPDLVFRGAERVRDRDDVDSLSCVVFTRQTYFCGIGLRRLNAYAVCTTRRIVPLTELGVDLGTMLSPEMLLPNVPTPLADGVAFMRDAEGLE
jgi:hypothetical protein